MTGDITIEAYDARSQQIFGNGDGQALLRGFKDYKRSNAYKRVKTLAKEFLSFGGRAVLYKIVDDQGKLIEEIRK